MRNRNFIFILRPVRNVFPIFSTGNYASPIVVATNTGNYAIVGLSFKKLYITAARKTQPLRCLTGGRVGLSKEGRVPMEAEVPCGDVAGNLQAAISWQIYSRSNINAYLLLSAGLVSNNPIAISYMPAQL